MTSSKSNVPAVCVITHPLGTTGENATRTLLDILAAITTVSLIAIDLPSNSKIRNRHETVELSQKGAAQSNIVLAAFRFLLNQFRMCYAITRRDEPVVLFFGATTYLLPIGWARLLGRTVLIEPRGDVPLTLELAWEQQFPHIVASAVAGLVRLLERTSFELADRIITYTPGMAAEIGLDPSASHIYPNGARYVDTERFRPTVPYTNRDLTVGFVGRLDEEKGIRTLAYTVEQISPDITFRFIGDGNLTEWLLTRLAPQIESGQVHCTGWVEHDDLPQEFNQLRLLVLPSSPTEGLPTTILEALACGTPVYSTPVSGVSDVVKAGETGFFIDQLDPQKMAEEISEILDRDDLNRISENGRSLIEDEFAFESAVDRYRKLLNNL